jgi:hypothetical protein
MIVYQIAYKIYQIVHKIYQIVYKIYHYKNPRSATDGNSCHRDSEVPQTTQGKHVDPLPQLYIWIKAGKRNSDIRLTLTN